MNPLDRLLAAKGKTRADFSKNSRMGSIFRQKGVPNTPELSRIVDIPPYDWQTDEELEDVRLWLTSQFSLPFREACHRNCGHEERDKNCKDCVHAAHACVCRGEGRMELRALQAAALSAIHDFRGMMAPVRVGGGKTLISFLAGSMLEDARVLLLIPAKLRDKTFREFSFLKRHWKAPANLKIMSYELLSRDRGVSELEEFEPTLILADEAHKLKNTRAACTRRVRRYLKEAEDCGFVDMSGTLTKRSLMEYHHRQQWALPEQLQPLPRMYNEARDWADALDVKVEVRLAPGGLLRLCNEDDLKELSLEPLKTLRGAFQRRLLSTPGIIGTTDMFDAAMAIIIDTLPGVAHNSQVLEAFKRLRDLWETPDGEPCATPADVWRHARELICGFYYRWEPAPPKEWLLARREWARFVRETLKYSRTYDTEMQVARACSLGELPDKEYTLWQAVRDTFQPNTVPVWMCDSMLNACTEWLRKNPGICWVEHVAFGERLEEVSGCAYYGRQGLDKRKRFIEAATGPIVASIAANNEGRNLQYAYSQNLVPSAPPGGDLWEQMMGRTHRDGQDAEEVTFTLGMECIEQYDAFIQAQADAEYIERTMGQPQKLLYADVDIMSDEDVEVLADSGDPRWSKKNAEYFS